MGIRNDPRIDPLRPRIELLRELPRLPWKEPLREPRLVRKDAGLMSPGPIPTAAVGKERQDGKENGQGTGDRDS